MLLSGAGSFVNGTLTLTYTIEVTGATVPAVVLSTDQDAQVPADDASVSGARLDGAPLPAGRVTRTGKDLVAALGALAPGRHAFSFPVEVADTVVGTTTNSANVVTGDGTRLDSGPVVVTVNQADLRVRLSEDSGPGPLGLGEGRSADAMVDIDNVGTVATDATLTVTLPAGVNLGPDGALIVTDNTATRLDCTTTGQQATCALGVLSPGAVQPMVAPLTVSIELVGGSDARAGDISQVGVEVEPTAGAALESDPSDNSLLVPVAILGTAVLSGTVAPARVTLLAGQQTVLTVRLTNRGPNTATNVFAAVELDENGTALQIVSLIGPGASPDARATQAHRASGRVTAALPLEDIRYWTPPDMTVGTTVVARLVLRATAAGTAQVRLSGSSTAGDPSCSSAFANCFLATATLTIRPPAPPRPAPAGNGPGTTLADTGAPALPLTLLGVLLLAVGGATTRLGRRRA